MQNPGMVSHVTNAQFIANIATLPPSGAFEALHTYESCRTLLELALSWTSSGCSVYRSCLVAQRLGQRYAEARDLQSRGPSLVQLPRACELARPGSA